MRVEAKDARSSTNVRLARAHLKRTAKKAAQDAIAGVLKTTDARTIGDARLSREERQWVVEQAARAATAAVAGSITEAMKRAADKAARFAMAELVRWVEEAKRAKLRRSVMTAEFSRDKHCKIKGTYAQMSLDMTRDEERASERRVGRREVSLAQA